MKRFLHIGCGPKRKDRTTREFAGPDWEEVRFDIDPRAEPDIVGSMLDMAAVPTASMDAVFSSHNIEHLYPHEVPQALREFRRVLKPDGFAIVTCPDLQSVAALIADDKLMEPAYTSPAGPIAPVDILFGYRPELAQGNLYMAHRTGFTQRVLNESLIGAGFCSIVAWRRFTPFFDLWAIATATPIDEASLRNLTRLHFPQ